MKPIQAVVGMIVTAVLGFIAGFAVNSTAGSPREASPSAPPAPSAPKPPPPEVSIPKAPEPNAKDVEPDQSSVPVDLSMYFNAKLTGDWHDAGTPANDLSELPTGLQPMWGTQFDVQGVIQLGGNTRKDWGKKYPPSVLDIRVGLRCRRLQFLIGTGLVEREGVIIGNIVVRHAGNHVSEIPIIYGRHVRDWWFDPKYPRHRGGVVVWSGRNPATRDRGSALQLYKIAWVNPRPESPVESIDLVSLMTGSAPFVVAVTADVPVE